jgi:hypothetical protein
MINRDRAYYVQLAILALLAFVFFDLTLLGVNEGRGPLLLTGPVIFALAALVPLRLRPSPSAGREMIAVMFVAALTFFMPLSTKPPIEDRAAAAAALGVLVTEGLWALHRYPPVPDASAGRWIADISRAVRLGLLIATGFSILAGVIFAIGAASDSSHAANVGAAAGLTIAGYFVGAVVAGTLAGLLRPALTWPLGVMCAGILGGAVVYGAVGPAVALIEQMEGNDSMSLAEMARIAAACGLLGGPPAAVAFKWSDARQRWRGA